jgi:hypothetical protein
MAAFGEEPPPIYDGENKSAEDDDDLFTSLATEVSIGLDINVRYLAKFSIRS